MNNNRFLRMPYSPVQFTRFNNHHSSPKRLNRCPRRNQLPFILRRAQIRFHNAPISTRIHNITRGQKSPNINMLSMMRKIIINTLRRRIRVRHRQQVNQVPSRNMTHNVSTRLISRVLRNRRNANPLTRPRLLPTFRRLRRLPSRSFSIMVQIVANAHHRNARPISMTVIINARRMRTSIRATITLISMMNNIQNRMHRFSINLSRRPILIIIRIHNTRPRHAILLGGITFLTRLLRTTISHTKLIRKAFKMPSIRVYTRIIRSILLLLRLRYMANFPRHSPPTILKRLRSHEIILRSNTNRIVSMVTLVTTIKSLRTTHQHFRQLSRLIRLRATIISMRLPNRLDTYHHRRTYRNIPSDHPTNVARIRQPNKIHESRLRIRHYTLRHISNPMIHTLFSSQIYSHPNKIHDRHSISRAQTNSFGHLSANLTTRLLSSLNNRVPQNRSHPLNRGRHSIHKMITIIAILQTIRTGLNNSSLSLKSSNRNHTSSFNRNIENRNPELETQTQNVFKSNLTRHRRRTRQIIASMHLPF